MLKVAILTSDRAPGLESLRRHPLCGSLFEIDCVLTRRPPRDLRLRAEYDRETAGILHLRGIDFVILLGYLFIVTDPLLGAFPDRILNVHDGDPKYSGLHATRNAIAAGERQTRSVVHTVTRDLDAGPLIARSEPLSVPPFVTQAVFSGEMDIVRAYAYAHREWMMRNVWGDLVAQALERVTVLEEAVV
jgi:folate-dependent phosphoribosylglycinamide formyltransferase PurN